MVRSMLKCLVLCLPLTFIQLGCSKESPVEVVDSPAQTGNEANTPAQPASPDRAQIEGRIVKIFGEQLEVDPRTIDVNASLGDQKIQADELDIVELVMAVEEEFKIEIKDEEVDLGGDLTKSVSVKKFADIVASKKNP
jgi:acyl carrier protein